MSAGPAFQLALNLPAEFTVGQWAGAVRAAANRVPRQLLDADGRWHANPARAAAEREVAEALRTVAGVLEISLAQVGPCGACSAYHHRYGDGGRPLCPPCQVAAEARRSGRVVSEVGNHGEPPARAA